jgi:hypothetical protein
VPLRHFFTRTRATLERWNNRSNFNGE